MSSDTMEVEFRLKVMINKQKSKVLFTEVDSHLADILLSFLTLPLGTIVRLLKKHYEDDQETTHVNIGSLTTLYDGLANLESTHFWTKSCKNILLNPESSLEAECRKMKLYISDTYTTKMFSCQDWNCEYRLSGIKLSGEISTCSCGKTMNRVVCLEESNVDEDCAGGVFTSSTYSFLISDDLKMVPNVSVSIMQSLRNLGITDIDGCQLMNVTFGFNEIMDLLKGSLLSATPLTDVILNKRRADNFAALTYEPGMLFHDKNNYKEATSNNSKKMNLRLMVQKSTNKLLFAQAEDGFADFLFSFLTIPLGQVERLLENKTSLKSIDNLYRSVADIHENYLATADTRNKLMNPKIPDGYISKKNQIIPLHEQIVLYYHQDFKKEKEWMSYSNGINDGTGSALTCNKGHEDYLKGPKLFMVADDLTVTPLCMFSSISILKELKISLSDVKEVEVDIGVEEALRILKASLTSTSALTNGLMIIPS